MSLQKKFVRVSPNGVEADPNVISGRLGEPQVANMAAEAQSPASESEASESDVTWNDEEFAAGFKNLLNEINPGATDPEDESELKAILKRLWENANQKAPGNGDKNKTPAVITPDLLVTALRSEGAQYFSNTKNEPVVYFPNDPHNKYWPAGHERIVGLLHSLNHQLSEGGHLKSNVLTTTMALIKEECYAGPRLLTEIESSEVEKNPIIPAIIEFVTKETTKETPKCQGPLKELFTAVNDFRTSHMAVYSGYFPPTTSIFSRCLSRLVPALRELGIEVVRTHKDDGSHYEITRLSHFQSEPDAISHQPSDKPSDVSPKKGRDFKPADESDGTERFDDVPAKATEVPSPKTVEVEAQDVQAAAKGGAA